MSDAARERPRRKPVAVSPETVFQNSVLKARRSEIGHRQDLRRLAADDESSEPVNRACRMAGGRRD